MLTKKAFDKCDHGVIVHKVCTKEIIGKLGCWVHNFLRSLIVRGNDMQRIASIVKRSGPQASSLLP